MSLEKRISFKLAEKRLLDFKIKLRHDGLSQTLFLSEIVDLYVSGSPLLSDCVIAIRDARSKHSGTKLRRSAKLESHGQYISSRFKMSKKDKEEIYSLLEEEVGEI